MPQISNKKKLKKLKIAGNEDEKRLLNERTKLFRKNISLKKQRKQILQRIHQIDRILGLI